MIAFDLAAVGSLMGGMAGSGMAGGMGGWMFAFPILALFTVSALIAVGLVGIKLLASETDDGPDAGGSDETPVERLQRRYAAGELTEAEFERGLERELERERSDGVSERTAAETESVGEAARAR